MKTLLSIPFVLGALLSAVGPVQSLEAAVSRDGIAVPVATFARDWLVKAEQLDYILERILI